MRQLIKLLVPLAGLGVAITMAAGSASAATTHPASAAHVAVDAAPAGYGCDGSPFLADSDYGYLLLPAGSPETAVTFTSDTNDSVPYLCAALDNGTYAVYEEYGDYAGYNCLATENPPDLEVDYGCTDSPVPSWEQYTDVLIDSEWMLKSAYDSECVTIYAVTGGYQSELEPCGSYLRQQNLWLVDE